MTAPVKTKPFYASKTFWAALAAAGIGAYRLIAPNYHWDVGWVPAAEYILTGLGLWGIRTSTTTIGPSATPDNVVPSAPTTPAETINGATLPSTGLEDLK